MSMADGSITRSFRRIRLETFLLNSVKEVNSASLYCLIIVGRQRETSRKNRSVLELKSVSLITGAICAPNLALFFANADISLLGSRGRSG